MWLQKAYGYATPEKVSEKTCEYFKASHRLAGLESYVRIAADYMPEERRKEVALEIAKAKGEIDSLRPYTISIASLKREDKEKTKAFLMLELVKLNVRLHLKNPMSSQDIEIIAEVIMRDYTGLKVADMAAFFEKLCTGAYGQFYERLDSSKIIPSLEEFYDERLNRAYEMRMVEHRSLMSDRSIVREKRIIDLKNIENSARGEYKTVTIEKKKFNKENNLT